MAIKDLGTATLSLAVADAKPLQSLTVRVDIEHTYIGDLIVTLKGPSGIGVPNVVLHNREGGSRNNIKKEFDVLTTPALSGFVGKSPAGTWKLHVADKEKADTGRIRGLTLELTM